MGQTTDQIVNDIDQKREHLKSNLEELEGRLKAATDWRTQVDRHPTAMIFAAMVGGVLLSAMIGKRTKNFDE
jgi:lipopolysaccharide biosynthesis regulator YciM